MMRTAVSILASLAIVISVAACGQDTTSQQTPSAETGLRLNGDFSGSGPGTLVEATNLPTVDLRLSRITSVAARVVYRSTSGIDNSATTVSGTVFVPKGQVPDGGWPVIALGHPTTGVQTACAPSLSSNLQFSADLVIALVKVGYAVALSDYQGLGLSGTYHPYLDSTTSGYNLIDSVRAARKLSGDLSDRWLALGGSQGAQAAWAANELATTYGRGLTLLGSVSSSVPADITGFAASAAAGDLTSDQKSAYQLILDSLSKEHPDFNLDDYRRGIVKEKWDLLLACQGSGAEVQERVQVANEVTDDDLRPSSAAATAVLRGYLAKTALPKTPAAAPMLVIYGGQDAFIPPAWTDRALERACKMGDVIQIQLQPDKGHGDVDLGSVFAWITGRFNNDPAPNDCKSLLAPAPPAGEGEQ